MLVQFGVIYTGKVRPWRITELRGEGDVLEQGFMVSDHPTKKAAVDKAQEYKASYKEAFPEDEVRVVVEGA